jgi:hypothetical protein
MPDEASELKENAERAAKEPVMTPVILTMAILPVLVAAVTLLGHRAHTEEMLLQTRSADQWSYYQAKEIRRRNVEMLLDELSVFSLQDPAHVAEVKDKYAKQAQRYADEAKEIQAQARKAEDEVKVEEARADRYDLAEVLLEVGLVITSITLMTRRRVFWLAGIVFSIAGLAVGAAGWMVH